MFDSLVWRECVPPKPCVVSTAAVFPHLGYGGSWRADRVKLYVRTNGLRIESEMPGELLAWVKLVDDSWMAKVLVQPTLLRRRFPMLLWVTADAVRDAAPPAGA